MTRRPMTPSEAAAAFLVAAFHRGVRIDRQALPVLGVRVQPQSPAHVNRKV